MSNYCCAFGCSNHSLKKECIEKKISFHLFPHGNEALMRTWLAKIKRKNFEPTRNTKICSAHFEDICFDYQNYTKRRFLKKDAVPTLFTFSSAGNKRKRTSYTNESVSSGSPEDVRQKWDIQLPKNFQATTFSKLSSKHFTDDSFDKIGGTWLKSTVVPKTFDFPDHLKESEEKRHLLSSEDFIDGHLEETSGKEANILELKNETKQDYEELSIIKQMEDDIRKEFLDEMQETVQNSEIPNDEDDELLNVQLELNQAYTEINILTKTKDMIAKELSAAFKRQKSLFNTISQKDKELSKLKLELEEANANINIISGEKYSFVEKLEMALSNQKILENMLSERPELEKNLKQAFSEIDALRKERDELQEKQTAANATKAILNDPNKLRYYTGLKSVEDFFSLLMLLDKFKHETNNVPIETKILIVLMRLRGHYKYGDLAYRFDTTGGTISRVCDRLIPFLGRRLDDLINNPTQDVFKTNLPVGFKINVYEDLLQKIQKYSKVENKKLWSEI